MLHRFEMFVVGVGRCYRSIQKIKNTEMTELGLRGAHVMCVFYLHCHPEGLTAAELSALGLEDKAAVSRTLAELSEKGFINVPRPEKGRKYRARVTLTPEGEALGRRVELIIDRWVEAGGGGLTDEEREIFYRALDRIADNLEDRLDSI